ncbi:transposase [Candidatus Regiella insecticola]|uniref:Transposase n=1 Tax=Candidatus Regiella insecticola TaxID=138073 RepID=A0A6L2ZMJ2_9ENTR|nr:transposase [Candidatus Regiella insecticola]
MLSNITNCLPIGVTPLERNSIQLSELIKRLYSVRPSTIQLKQASTPLEKPLARLEQSLISEILELELAPYFMMYTNLMTYPLKFRQHVLAIKEKLTYAKTASRFGVGMASLMRWNRRITPCTTHNKPATKIDMEALAQDVATYPDDYQYERAQRFGVSAQGIRHALKRLRVSRKKNTSASQS